jgi:hypothetical protein
MLYHQFKRRYYSNHILNRKGAIGHLPLNEMAVEKKTHVGGTIAPLPLVQTAACIICLWTQMEILYESCTFVEIYNFIIQIAFIWNHLMLVDG